MTPAINRLLSGACLSFPYVKPALIVGIPTTVMAVAMRVFSSENELVTMGALFSMGVAATGTAFDTILYIVRQTHSSDPGY